MSDTVITVENVSKRYHLGMVRHDTLRDRLTHAMRAPLNRLRGVVEPDPTEFWALRDINFEVKRGEVLGIIGRNGAGKSTLLKILSRITEPTTGRIRIRGRVASLLEVGTGFHPELSGRENIFLNGAILGMSRAEIRRKFDEIVAFAEVERFLDTPVKHYSSGMYVRLAFAVAAHLEPEILIVDEVLAVGDAAFQQKCLGRMQTVAHDGRTILFVSHNMDAMLHLCTHGILIEGGRIKSRGEPAAIVPVYLNTGMNHGTYEAQLDKGHGILRVTTELPTEARPDLVFVVMFRSEKRLNRPTLGVVVHSVAGAPLFGSNSLFHPWSGTTGPTAGGTAIVTFKEVPLWNGSYRASFWLSDDRRPVDALTDAVTFEVSSRHLPLGAPPPKEIGSVHVRGEWRIT
ncbi:MAG: polysaccharide ABC transporter ATP-binding protein [Opitutaceae bacterium]|nr:polysaccharide ABC transporter ATP-binding protein [Opitutaceae bacterium]